MPIAVGCEPDCVLVAGALFVSVAFRIVFVPSWVGSGTAGTSTAIVVGARVLGQGVKV